MAAHCIAVTGASGFIGRHAIAPLLALGYTPHLFSHRRSARDGLAEELRARCHEHQVDLLDERAVGDLLARLSPSHLLHFAWHGDTRTRWTSPANDKWAAATIALARAFAAAGGQRMVVSGSCAEYDWNHETLREDRTPLAPATSYGRAKVQAHAALRGLCADHGVSLAWGRIFFCYGPAEPGGRLIHQVITALLNEQPVDCTPGTQVRDYLYSEDIGRAFAMLVAQNFDGAINVASGHGIAVRELVETAAEKIGRPELVRFGAKPLAESEPARLVADVTRLRDAIGFRPRFDLDRGIDRTIAWFRAHGG